MYTYKVTEDIDITTNMMNDMLKEMRLRDKRGELLTDLTNISRMYRLGARAGTTDLIIAKHLLSCIRNFS